MYKSHTACIAKGKAFHEYEFGNKVGLICAAKRQILLAIMVFEGRNSRDRRMIAPLLAQMETGSEEPGV